MFHPTTFGKYFLTRRIAVGGMAEVYAAKLYGADGFEKDLVIKQILPQYAKDPLFVQSFVAEAKIAVSLNHANIVGIYELGRVDGTYFIAMELVDGLDVFDMLEAARRHQIDVGIGECLLIVEEVARGLDYAHRKHGPDGAPLGLVHRDLNPRNVLVSREGEVKILDFGIAKVANQVAAMPKTRAGVVKGTSGYMSPEQATGREVDARTDLYQAGLLLFELLTGQALFWRPDDDTTRDLMRKHEVIMPSSLNSNVSPELDRITLQLLTRRPEERIQTAAELAGLIGRLRYGNYPAIDARRLGAIVAALADLEAKKEAHEVSHLPSTAEVSAAFDGAIEGDAEHARVETIATRAPSFPGRATTRSQPMVSSGGAGIEEMFALASDPQLPQRPMTIRSPSQPGSDGLPLVTPIEASSVESLMKGSRAATPAATEPPPAPNRGSAARFWPIAAALILLVGSLSYLIARPPTPPKASKLPAIERSAQRVPVEPDSKAVEEPPEKPVEPPSSPPQNKQTAPPPPRVDRATPESKSKKVERGLAAKVSFGTRSCSGRVKVDGRIVARSTPSFDHRLSPGRHRVVLEGTGCPAVERPGSLRRAVPTVSSNVRVEAGESLRIIADFDNQRVIVKRMGGG